MANPPLVGISVVSGTAGVQGQNTSTGAGVLGESNAGICYSAPYCGPELRVRHFGGRIQNHPCQAAVGMQMRVHQERFDVSLCVAPEQLKQPRRQ